MAAADYLSAMDRPTPFDLVFADFARDRFPDIQTALAAGDHDPRDRDAFLLLRETVTLLRGLRPDEGLGEGIDQLAALLHHAYLFWVGGAVVTTVDAEMLDDLLRPDYVASGPASMNEPIPAIYAQLAPGRVWAAVVPQQSAEPMDGCFVHAAPAPGALRVLGVFGVRPDRDGFSVVEAIGTRAIGLERPDGSPLFSSTLPGGEAAGLRSLAGAEELLELAWRVRPQTAGTATGAAQWTA